MATPSVLDMETNTPVTPAPQLREEEFNNPQSEAPLPQPQPQIPDTNTVADPGRLPVKPDLQEIQKDEVVEPPVADLNLDEDPANSSIISDDEDAFSGKNMQGGADGYGDADSDDMDTDTMYLTLAKFFKASDGRNVANILVDISESLRKLLADPSQNAE